jgi:hypothetical protein
MLIGEGYKHAAPPGLTACCHMPAAYFFRCFSM